MEGYLDLQVSLKFDAFMFNKQSKLFINVSSQLCKNMRERERELFYRRPYTSFLKGHSNFPLVRGISMRKM